MSAVRGHPEQARARLAEQRAAQRVAPMIRLG